MQELQAARAKFDGAGRTNLELQTSAPLGMAQIGARRGGDLTGVVLAAPVDYNHQIHTLFLKPPQETRKIYGFIQARYDDR